MQNECNFPDLYNNEYKTSKLKTVIEMKIGSRIKFWKKKKPKVILCCYLASSWICISKRNAFLQFYFLYC
jgi:hypothetical protein